MSVKFTKASKYPVVGARTPGASWMRRVRIEDQGGAEYVRGGFWMIRSWSPAVAPLLASIKAGKARPWLIKAMAPGEPVTERVKEEIGPVATVADEWIPIAVGTGNGEARRIDGDGFSMPVNADLLALVLAGVHEPRITCLGLGRTVVVWNRSGELEGAVAPLGGSWDELKARWESTNSKEVPA